MKDSIKILGIDDDETFIEALRLILEMNKDIIPKFELFTDGDKLLKAITPDVHIILIDYKLKNINGLELIRKIVETNPYCQFIMISGITGPERERLLIELVNISYGIKYIEKGGDIATPLLFFIADIMRHIGIIETFFYESRRNKKLRTELKDKLIDLKETI